MKLQPDEDYYILPDGRLVFTAAYLLKRGWCCGNGCLNCPYDYEAVPEPQRSRLRAARNPKSSPDGR
jgi:hypothetical protein